MTNSQKMNEVSKVHQSIKEAGLEDIVDIRVEVMENQYDKKTPHVVANIPTIKATQFPDGQPQYKLAYFENIEELNNYFSGYIFAMGITQRKDYLLASTEVKIECHKQNIHPALYKAPTDEVDVMQDMPNPIPVERKERRKTVKYPNGYQGKIDFYLKMAADHIGKDNYSYFEGKVKYFLKRQEAWLIKNKTANI